MSLLWVLPAALSFLGFGVGNTFLKHASHEGEAPPALLVVLHLAAFSGAVVWALGSGRSFDPRAYLLGIGASLIGFTGLVTFYVALQRGLAVKVFPIMRLNTLVTVGLAVLVLAERPSVVVAGGIAVAIGAMWILSGGGDDDDPPPGMTWFALALVTLFTFGTVNFLVQFGSHTPGARVSTVVGLYSLTPLLALAYHTRDGGRITRRAVTHGTATGLLYVVGFFGLLSGYALETVSRVAPFMGLNILIPMAASVTFMDERVTWRVAVGTPLALLAMYLLSVG